MEPKKLKISPFCSRLRSKKYYFLEAPALTEDDILDGSNRCWCQHTMEVVGPDGEIVEPEFCQAGRTCFEGLGPDA